MSTNKWYSIPRNQRLGILVLVFTMSASLLAWRIYQAHSATHVPDEKEMLHKYPVATPAGSAGNRGNRYNNGQKETIIAPRPFDPNTASKEMLEAAGIPSNVATILVRYRTKGARFYRKEDIKKVYGMTDDIYTLVSPYISIPQQDRAQHRYSRFPTRTQTSSGTGLIELNTADEQTLMQLKGIGPAYARRIIAYRDKLGGFIKPEQLREVYGFPDSTYQQLKEKITTDMTSIRKIRINYAGEQELTAHPYIRNTLAVNIIKLRNDLKKFTRKEQLRQVPLINEEKYRKIAPYLDMDTSGIVY